MDIVNHRFVQLMLVIIAYVGFSPFASCLIASPQTVAGTAGTARLDGNERKDQWSQASSNLKIRLDIDETQSFVAGQEFEVELKLHSPEANDKTHPKLLAGRFVFVMVPVNGYSDREPTITTVSFSGGGGIDYRGDKGLKYKVRAPDRSGDFQIFANVHSTLDDIKQFMMMAKMRGDAKPWWRGVLASPSQLVVVTEPKTEPKSEQQPIDASRLIDADVSVHRFSGKPRIGEVRVENNSRGGWHNELRVSIGGVSMPFGRSALRGIGKSKVELDPDTEYTYFVERIERFSHLEFALRSIEKEGVVVYSTDETAREKADVRQ